MAHCVRPKAAWPEIPSAVCLPLTLCYKAPARTQQSQHPKPCNLNPSTLALCLAKRLQVAGLQAGIGNSRVTTGARRLQRAWSGCHDGLVIWLGSAHAGLRATEPAPGCLWLVSSADKVCLEDWPTCSQLHAATSTL